MRCRRHYDVGKRESDFSVADRNRGNLLERMHGKEREGE